MRLWRQLSFLFLISAIHGLTLSGTGNCDTKRALILSYLITNPTNMPVSGAKFYTYLPLDKTSWQKLIRVEHSCSNATLIHDSLGNTILGCNLPLMPPYSNLPVDVRAWLQLKGRPEASTLPPKDRARALGDEPYITPSDKGISSLARRFKAGSKYLRARRIYNWIKNNIKFKDFISRPMGATWALRHKSGDCTEGMAIFVALARANKIPAKGVAGYLTNRNGRASPLSYHNWALFYGKSAWRIADPKAKIFDTDYGSYVATTMLGTRKKRDIPLGPYERFKVTSKLLRVRQL